VREIQRDGTAEVVGFAGPRTRDLAARARAAGAGAVVVATDERRAPATGELLRCRAAGMEVIDAATLATRVLHRLPVDLVHPADLIFQDGFHHPLWLRMARRALSLTASLVMLTVAAPLVAAVAILIKLDSPGPVIYRQQRVGRAGRLFWMLKFRTMRTDAETGGRARWAAREDPRVTRVGRVLRRYRIDELPQLVNVLRGEMELVGPRPEREAFVRQLREQIPYYDLRHLVPPGITGYAQVLYPYAASVEETREKLQYDLYYVRHLSLALDLYVLALTARVVLFGRGAR
jgi:exopolysaccharide biosynthesis polyprenyl glycosylphosphotransferase